MFQALGVKEKEKCDQAAFGEIRSEWFANRRG